MNEAVFPLLGPFLVLGIALPLSAVVAKVFLSALWHFRLSCRLDELLGLRYAVIVGSSAVPVGWFLSASLHQAESSRHAVVCAALHGPSAFCPEAAGFSATLLVLAGVLGFFRLARVRRSTREHATVPPRATESRVAGLLANDAKLRSLIGRVVVSSSTRIAIATSGVLWPRVVVQADFADSLDDEALTGALYHELEHVSARDPLRYAIVSLAFAVNPFGAWLLQIDFAQWLLGREVQCDREAVSSGASAPALAHAVVRAARPERAVAAMLGPNKIESLRFRVALLLSYAERHPERRTRDIGLQLAAAVFAFALILPHRTGTELLDVVHEASEGAVAMVLRN